MSELLQDGGTNFFSQRVLSENIGHGKPVNENQHHDVLLAKEMRYIPRDVRVILFL